MEQQDKKKQKIKISKTFLMSGNDLKISDKISIKHPSLKEIFELGNGINCDYVYWGYINTLLSDPYDNMVMLDDMGIDYEEIESFDVFVLQYLKAEESYEKNKEAYDKIGLSPIKIIHEALEFFFGKHNFSILKVPEINDYIIIDVDTVVCDNDDNIIVTGNEYIITREIFNYLSAFLMEINCIDTSQRINPKNKSYKKMLIEDKRDEEKRRLKRKNNNEDTDYDYIGKMIGAVCFGGNGSESINDINALKIYQLFYAYKITIKKDNHNHIMVGVYTGNVDINKINKRELNWIDS